MAVKCTVCGLDVAEDANFCGHCGAPRTTQGRVAATPNTQGAPAGSSQSDTGAQYLSPPPDQTQEVTIWEEHPSIRTAMPAVGFVAAGAIFLIIVVQFLLPGQLLVGFALWTLIILAALLIVAFILLRDVIRRYSVHYKLTSQRIFITTGIFNKRTDEIELEKYKDVFVKQDIYDKMVGCGDIEIVTGDLTSPTEKILDVTDPVGKKEQIRAAARARKSTLGITRREEL